MRRLWICVGLIALFSAPFISVAVAEGETPAGLKQEIMSDKQAIRDQAAKIKEEALAARQAEKHLRDQIKAARQAGDASKVKELEAQLRAMHKVNVQEMRQDKNALKEAKHELVRDRKEAHREGIPHPKKYKEGNPPGPKGGPGTDWKNPPGPKGGPGAGPRKK